MKTSLRSLVTVVTFLSALAVTSSVQAGPGLQYWKNRTTAKAPQVEASATTASTTLAPKSQAPYCNACAPLHSTAKSGS
jgi:hypothetical protein